MLRFLPLHLAPHPLYRDSQVRARFDDLRWLRPLNAEAIARHARECARILIVDEGRRSAGVGQGIITAIVESGSGAKPLRRVVGVDTFTPLAGAAFLVLPRGGGYRRCHAPAVGIGQIKRIFALVLRFVETLRLQLAFELLDRAIDTGDLDRSFPVRFERLNAVCRNSKRPALARPTEWQCIWRRPGRAIASGRASKVSA